MSYPITDIDGIDSEEARTLKLVGIRTTERLLEAAQTPRDRELLAERTGFDKRQILTWANMADRMRIKGVGEAANSSRNCRSITTGSRES